MAGETWDVAGVGAALAIAVGAAVALSLLSSVLLRRGWRVPGGLVATVVVALVPLIVYAFERGRRDLARPGTGGVRRLL